MNASVVIKIVERVFGVHELELLGKSRTAEVCDARAVAMHCCCRQLNMGPSKVARIFRKTHCSVIKSRDRIDGILQDAPSHHLRGRLLRVQGEVNRYTAEQVETIVERADLLELETLIEKALNPIGRWEGDIHDAARKAEKNRVQALKKMKDLVTRKLYPVKA